jgi:hypothetical protein
MSGVGFKLTEYSHGAGCGCKISPKVLGSILASKLEFTVEPQGQQALEALLQAEALQADVIGELVAREPDRWIEVH